MGKSITIVGFGNQGQAWGENLRDSGWEVSLALRENGPSSKLAADRNFQSQEPSKAIPSASIIALLIPDDAISAFMLDHLSHFRTEQTLVLAHGYAFHFKTAVWPEHVNRVLVAPKGIGSAVRSEFEKGKGVPAVLAIDHDENGKAWSTAAEVAHGIGATRVGIYKATVKEEVEADLFSEQALLCGGLPGLIAETFRTMVKSGISPEVAYLECVHELAFITDLFQKKGISKTLELASPTARFGGLLSAKRLISPILKDELRRMMKEIQNGTFQTKLERESVEGFASTNQELDQLKETPLEQTGQVVRDRLGNL